MVASSREGPGHGGSSASALPSSRAFVVQLAADAEGGGALRGRAGHLASGRAIRFESWTRLGELVADLLRDESTLAGAPGKGGSDETNR